MPAPLSAIAALTLALLLVLLAWRRARSRWSRASRRRNRRARRAETDAERLLATQGFAILECQPTGRWSIEVDGEPREVSCRADLLVERGGRLYVARRQLLEYLLAFDADGALVVDMERRRVRTVAFPGLLPAR